MAITLVASVTATPGSAGGTTAAITTTGATLIVVSVSQLGIGTGILVTDSKGNTWTPLTLRTSGNARHRFSYCLNPTVGTGHTFTAATAGTYPAIFVYAFAGVSTYQTEIGTTGGTGTTSLATGSVTPSASGSLILTALGGNNQTTASLAPAGFTLALQPYFAGRNIHAGAAYQVPATAAPLNPTWTFPAQSAAVATAVFGPTPTTATVPNVVGALTADATAAITAVGLTVGTVTTALTTSVPAGHVSSQSPAAGTVVALGSAVDLVVAVTPGLSVTIDGVAQRILHESLSIQATVNGRDRLSATLPMPTVAPEIRQEIIVTDNGVRIFGGYLDTARQRAGSSWTDRDDQLLYDITAADYTVLADWRYSNGPQVAEPLKAYLAAGVVPFLPGVTLDPAQVDGPLLPTRTVVMQTITQVLDELSTITGYVWNIDYDGRLKMWLPSAEAAPVDVLDSNDTAIGDITVEPIATGYATSIFLLAGDGATHILTETFVGDGTTLTFPLAHRLVTHAGTLTHAGATENVGPGEAWELDATATPFMFILRRAIGGAPALGAVITFPYTAQYPLIYRRDDLAAVAALGGQYIEQLFTEPTVFDPAQAAALADGYLAQVTHPTREVRYTTLRGDIAPGQTQTIAIASRGLSGSFVITDVETRMQDPLLIRAVTAADPGPYPGSWRDVYKLWLEGATRLDAAAAATSPGGGGGGGGAPAPHAATHAAGGGDPVVITALAGFPGGTATFLRADGGFAAPAGTTTVVTRTDTGTVHDWAPGLSGDTLILWNGATNLSLTGLAGGVVGQVVTIWNYTTAAILTCAHGHMSSASGNRFANTVQSASTSLAPRGYVSYVYDSNGFWLLIAHEQGTWITPAFSAANFTATGAMWTVEAADVLEYGYRVSGRTLSFALHVSQSSLSAAASALQIVIPGGFTCGFKTSFVFMLGWGNGGQLLETYSYPGDSVISVRGFNGAALGPSTNNTSINLALTLPVT